MKWFRKKWKSVRRWWKTRRSKVAQRPEYKADGPKRRLWGWSRLRGFLKTKGFQRTLGYWRRRDWRRLLVATPALLAFIGLATLGALMARESDQELAGWYKEGALEAQRAGDVQKALGLADSASRLSPDPYSLMYMASLTQQNGDLPRAKAILESLAPSDRKGFAPAHLALAKLLFKPPLTSENAARAEKHLVRITDGEGAISAEANATLGKFYMANRRWDQAISALNRTSAQSPARLQLAIAYNEINDREKAEWEAKGCRDALIAKCEANPQDYDSIFQLVHCAVILREHDFAVQLLNTILLNSNLPAQIRSQLVLLRASVYVQLLTFLETEKKDQVTARFAVLEQALATTPNDVRLLQKLATFIDPQSPEGAAVRKILKQQIAEGRNVGFAHFTLGNFAWVDGNQDLARVHLEQAAHSFPQKAWVSNNLAWVLASSSSAVLDGAMKPANDLAGLIAISLAKSPLANLERALKLADDAIRQDPNQPEFRHTRANILIKMDRWKEAILDFEYALDGGKSGDRAAIHASLAKAYEKLGDRDLADIHRTKAASPAKESKKDDAKNRDKK